MTSCVLCKPLSVRRQLLVSLPAVVAAVLLPQLFHLFGGISGLHTLPGETFLPMHLPVLFIGLYAGPVAGLVTGVFSPLISAVLTGMPTTALLPFMMIELAGYGAVAGGLRRTAMPTLLKVLVAQVAGRVLRALALVTAVTVFGYTAVPLSIIWTSVATGVWGMALQWCVLPVSMHVVCRHG